VCALEHAQASSPIIVECRAVKNATFSRGTAAWLGVSQGLIATAIVGADHELTGAVDQGW